jgi:hypothetical protein
MSQENHLGQRIVRICSSTRFQQANEDEAECCNPNIELKTYTASHVTKYFGSPLVVPQLSSSVNIYSIRLFILHFE